MWPDLDVNYWGTLILSSQGTGILQLLGLIIIVASWKPLFPDQAAFVVSVSPLLRTN